MRGKITQTLRQNHFLKNTETEHSNFDSEQNSPSLRSKWVPPENGRSVPVWLATHQACLKSRFRTKRFRVRRHVRFRPAVTCPLSFFPLPAFLTRVRTPRYKITTKRVSEISTCDLAWGSVNLRGKINFRLPLESARTLILKLWVFTSMAVTRI